MDTKKAYHHKFRETRRYTCDTLTGFVPAKKVGGSKDGKGQSIHAPTGP
jgi:hypothetical protein